MLYSGVVMCSLGLFLSAGYSVVTIMINTSSPTTTSTDFPVNGGSSSPPVNTGPVEWTADGEIKVGEYDYTDTFGNSYEIFWSSDDEYIYIGIRAVTTGWVALGFQPDNRSDTSVDMILGFVADDRSIVMYDLFYAEYPGDNPRDTVLGGTYDIEESDGVQGTDVEVSEDEDSPVITTIEFKRKLNTGDQYDQIIYSGPNNIIWAYGREDSRDTAAFEWNYERLVVD
jgi:hypothetical protein